MKAEMLEALGGEKKLAAEYPLIYQMIENAKELKAGDTDDFCGVTALGMNQKSVYAKSVVNLTDVSPLILSYLEIWDDDRNVLVCAFNRYDTDTLLSINDYDTSTAIEQVVNNKSNLRTRAKFVWSKMDGSSYTMTDDYASSNYYKGEEIVKSSAVTKPRAADGKKTKIAYNRTSQMGNSDYSYPNVMPINNEISIFCPFAGEATFSNDFIIENIVDETTVEDFKFKLHLFFNDQMSVDYSNKKSPTSQFVIDAENNKITWNFLDDWEIKKDISKFSVLTELTFHCRFTVMLNLKNEPEKYHFAKITINSSVASHTDPSTVIIEPIIIQWGCIAKDTKVLAADGSSIPAECVRIGDMLVTDNGIAAVQDVIRGMERELIYLKTTSGKELKCSDTHVLKTDRGLIHANRLTFADKLLTTDGAESLTDLYIIPYDDEVYNFSFDRNSQITTNNIITGDFGLQNDWTLITLPQEPPPLAQQAQSLFSQLL